MTTSPPTVTLTPLPGPTLTGLGEPVETHGSLAAPPGAPTIPMPCPSFLIEHDRGRVLFETGMSPKGLADPEQHFGDLPRRYGFETDPALGVDRALADRGYACDQIDYVVLSHLHFDHMGGAYLFPGATFVVGKGELGYAYHPDDAYRSLFLLADLEPTRSFRWVEVDFMLDLFGDGTVTVVPAPGHTPGSLALAVRTEVGPFLLSGDACHFETEVTTGIPWGMHDHVTAQNSLRRLLMLSRTWGAKLWINHSQAHWDRYTAELGHPVD